MDREQAFVLWFDEAFFLYTFRFMSGCIHKSSSHAVIDIKIKTLIITKVLTSYYTII